MNIDQPKNPITILFSYAHEDEALRDKLEKHLSSLKRSKRIICWHDRQIHAGDTWNLEIGAHLEIADIVLLLISSDFLSSDYCNQVEVRKALERHKKGGVCVIPIILREVDWRDEKFAKLQALPLDGRPVTRWPDEDAALFNVAQGIKTVIVKLETTRGYSVD